MRHITKKTLAAAAITLAMGGTANAGETFGTSGQWIFVSAHEMQLASPSCAWSYVGTGYYSILAAPGGTCTGNAIARGGFELPEGSRMTFQRLYYYNTSGTFTTFLTEYTSDNFAGTNPSFTEHSSDSTSAATGYNASQFTFTTPLIFDSFDTRVSPSRQRSYGFAVNMPTGNTSRIKGVALGYVRQIAPAPASASFNDVPTGHPFFNEVQQLAKSNITQGCGGGNYCPDATVTRGQMAAFLSRALGLHWDWNTDPAP